MNQQEILPAQVQQFQETVWAYYADYGRYDMAWRQPNSHGEFSPYYILVSEVMLQQTQVARVTQKFTEFMQKFPTVLDLAQAELGDVLRVWQGLGYNRRAKFLWQAAQMVLTDFKGVFPKEITELVKLPGVGINTAGAIRAYSWSLPSVFIETNIRTIYIYHFFNGQDVISDAAILPIITASMPEDTTQIREWYWALMDYGVYIKQTQGNLNKLSKSYAKQSNFNGSLRQLRGQIINILTNGPISFSLLNKTLSDDRLQKVLDDLVSEELIQLKGDIYKI